MAGDPILVFLPAKEPSMEGRCPHRPRLHCVERNVRRVPSRAGAMQWNEIGGCGHPPSMVGGLFSLPFALLFRSRNVGPAFPTPFADRRPVLLSNLPVGTTFNAQHSTLNAQGAFLIVHLRNMERSTFNVESSALAPARRAAYPNLTPPPPRPAPAGRLPP